MVHRPVPTVVFVPLAQNQARFYLLVAQAMRGLGLDASFISFHEPSVQMIASKGFEVFNFFEFLDATAGRTTPSLHDLTTRYGIENLNPLMSHEKITYEVRDTPVLQRKLSTYLVAMERLLDELEKRMSVPVAVVQELGGFISVVATVYAARARGWTNVFLEPAFFRGRVFHLLNTFAASRIEPTDSEVSLEVKRYIDDVLRTQQIVIPAKDASHYRKAITKIFSPHNIRRLVEKTVQKYIHVQREEFTHLRTQVVRHARMLASDYLLRRYCQDLPRDRKFIYYPLHVWTDVALTIRAPEYLDQYWLLDYLARTVPTSHAIVFKEHPAMVGGLSFWRVRELLRRYDNLILLRPWINNYKVIQAADAVVTVNSKSGAEALLLRTPLLTLGDSFYRASGLAVVAAAPGEIPQGLTRVLTEPPPPFAKVQQFFQAVWDHSSPGELYLDSPENVRTFALSLSRFLTELDTAVGTRTGVRRT